MSRRRGHQRWDASVDWPAVASLLVSALAGPGHEQGDRVPVRLAERRRRAPPRARRGGRPVAAPRGSRRPQRLPLSAASWSRTSSSRCAARSSPSRRSPGEPGRRRSPGAARPSASTRTVSVSSVVAASWPSSAVTQARRDHARAASSDRPSVRVAGQSAARSCAAAAGRSRSAAMASASAWTERAVRTGCRWMRKMPCGPRRCELELLLGRQILAAQRHVVGDLGELRRVDRPPAAQPRLVGLDRVAGDDEVLHGLGQARLLVLDPARGAGRR